MDAQPKRRDERLTRELDLSRFDEIRKLTDLLVNLWSSAKLAAERGDAACLKLNCQQAQAATKATFALVKRLGNEEPDDVS